MDTSTQLGPYKIEALIGAGGMGQVFRATDTRLHRTVAIKILPQDKVADPERKRRFLQEARAAAALNHPNIITLHDIANDSRKALSGGYGSQIQLRAHRSRTSRPEPWRASKCN